MEKKERYCDSCIRLETSQPAVSWCPECCDYLCENCVKCHKTNRFSMEHKVCNIEEREQLDNLGVNLFCKQHARKRLEVYCFDHDEPCCLMCATVSHRKCDKVSSLEDCTQCLGADVTRMLSILEEHQKMCVSKIELITNKKKSLKNVSAEVEEGAKTFSEECIQKMNEIERSALENLEKIEENESFRLQEMLDVLLAVQKRAEDNIKITKKLDDADVTRMLGKLEELQKTFFTDIERVTDDKKNLKKKIAKEKKRVKTSFEESIQTVKEEERRFLENLEKTEKNESVRLQGILDELLESQKTLEHNFKILKKSDEFPKVTLFLELKQIEKRVSEIHKQTNKLTKSYHTP